MTRLCWGFVDRLSRVLEADERETVLGDFAETGVSGAQAFLDLLSLVARRQASLWKDWRLWIALAAFAGLVGIPLSRSYSGLATALWMHMRAISHGAARYETGLTPAQDVVVLLCPALALILWSWCAGFVLASLSGRAIWISGGLFYLVWLPLLLAVLPFAALASIAVIAPSLCGVLYYSRRGTISVRAAVSLAVGAAVLIALATWTAGWQQGSIENLSGGAWQGGITWSARLLPFAFVSWPVGYMAVTAFTRREGIL